VVGPYRRLVVVHGALPPQNCDLWVTDLVIDAGQTLPDAGDDVAADGGLICFTPGTLIRTAAGQVRIEDLRPGDRVQTKDNGLQDVMWHGSRHLSGARLQALPGLRPVRIRAGALGVARPEAELVVSPRHRMLLKGAAAQALFNVDEVLVAAADLVNDHTILVDHFAREVSYIHILLEAHNVLWANGMETESFLPDAGALEHLEPAQRETLLAALPGPAGQAGGYGGPARRSLSHPEAAILKAELRG
jgi:Hint domain